MDQSSSPAAGRRLPILNRDGEAMDTVLDMRSPEPELIDALLG